VATVSNPAASNILLTLENFQESDASKLASDAFVSMHLQMNFMSE
jgi:hypothetical protein